MTLEEAKAYLRVDSDYEDGVIDSLASSAIAMCTDMARLTPGEWDAVYSYDEDAQEPATVEIRGEEYGKDDVLRIRARLQAAAYNALAYLYENREKADHHALEMNLRSLLSPVREGVL